MAHTPRILPAERRHSMPMERDSSAPPRVTVGLPVYNGERYLAEAIDSLLTQTFTDFELIICDNASTDRTEAIGREYAARDSRVRYCRNRVNIGLYPNFNLVRGMARGEFFKWLAHDDVCSPAYLERCVEALDAAPGASMAYTRATAIGPDGQPAPEFDWAEAEQYDDAKPEARFGRFVAGFDHSVAAGRQHVGLYVFGLIRMSALATSSHRVTTERPGSRPGVLHSGLNASRRLATRPRSPALQSQAAHQPTPPRRTPPPPCGRAGASHTRAPRRS